MNNRIGYLDFLRGIAIVTVVMGHILQYNFRGIAAENCFNFIYSFHMGFFFFISGCTASLSIEKNNWNYFICYLRKKALQLLVPFFVWGGLLYNGMDMDLHRSINRFIEMLQYPNLNAPWFIFELFYIQIVFFVICSLSYKLGGKKVLYFFLFLTIPIILVILLLKKQIIGPGFTLITPNYYLLFSLGVMTQNEQLTERIRILIILCCLIVFVLVAPLFNFQSGDLLLKESTGMVSSISFSVFAYMLIKNEFPNIDNRVRRFTNYLGRHTLEIYLTHFFIIKIFREKLIDTDKMYTIPLFLLLLLFSVPVCVIVIKISDIIKRIPILSIVLYGKR